MTKRKYPEPTRPLPTDKQLERWSWDSIVESTDGCEVEPDGRCIHGHVSWLIYLGFI